MGLFSKKQTIILKSEKQKDAYIERLEKAHINYDITETRDVIFTRDVTYYIHINSSDLKKVG